MKLLGLDLKESFSLWERVLQAIPAGTQTLSKAPNQFVEGVYPVFLERGEGSHVWDVDGNEYIDYPLALGTILLGHRYPRVEEAIKKQLKKGILFSLMHRLEFEVAERLQAMIPCAERVRFSKTGSEATSAAIRVARAATGREKIAFCGYHGWHDWYAVTTSRSKGIPRQLKDLIYPFEYNHPSSLEKVFAGHPGEIAAVMMEPVALDTPKDGFLEKVQNLAHKNGALLIFDEIVSGFRFAPGGAQSLFGAVPDLAAFGKSMANGMPLSALVGKKEFMKQCEEVFFSTTFGGETLSLAAAVAVLDELKEKPVIDHLWNQGRKLQEDFNQLAKERGLQAEFTGFPVRQFLVFKDPKGEPSKLYQALFWQETVKRGILFGNAQMISFSHSDEDIEKTLEACQEALDFVKKAEDSGNPEPFLEGKLPTDIFRKP